MPETAESFGSIIVCSQSVPRAKLIQVAIAHGGFESVVVVDNLASVRSTCATNVPDAVVIDLNVPAPGETAMCLELVRTLNCPVSIFVETDDPQLMRSALDAGAAAYIVKGLTTERVVPIIQMAISRFDAYSRLQGELDEAREALLGRKQIDQAKALLMRSKGLSEQQAYALLRKSAMDRNCKLQEIAESLILSAGLLEP